MDKIGGRLEVLRNLLWETGGRWGDGSIVQDGDLERAAADPTAFGIDSELLDMVVDGDVDATIELRECFGLSPFC